MYSVIWNHSVAIDNTKNLSLSLKYWTQDQCATIHLTINKSNMKPKRRRTERAYHRQIYQSPLLLYGRYFSIFLIAETLSLPPQGTPGKPINALECTRRIRACVPTLKISDTFSHYNIQYNTTLRRSPRWEIVLEFDPYIPWWRGLKGQCT